MSEIQRSFDPKKVAVANLSMATIYVDPEGLNGCIDLPRSEQARAMIMESLEKIGFDLEKRSFDHDISSSKPPKEAMQYDDGVYLTQVGLFKHYRCWCNKSGPE